MCNCIILVRFLLIKATCHLKTIYGPHILENESKILDKPQTIGKCV